MEKKSFSPISPIPKNTVRGWKIKIDGKPAKLNFLEGINPKVGKFYYGFNGIFDQPAIKQLPGRLVAYICNHPKHGLLMAGADEYRLLLNGKMFTPAGGFDAPQHGGLKNSDEYGKKMAERENFQESGMRLKNLHFAGRFVSNRMFFIADLKDKDNWTAESVYVHILDPKVLGNSLELELPKNKKGSGELSPEWDSITTLKFKPWTQCLASEDGVAVAAYAKAYFWWIKHKPKV